MKHKFESVSDIREWYERLWGKTIANRRFLKFKEMASSLKNEKDIDKKQRRKKIEKDFDFNKSVNNEISQAIQRVKSQHRETFKKYPSLLNYMINEVVYPNCIRNDKDSASNVAYQVLWLGRNSTLRMQK